MKVSEVIAKLQEILENKGDLEAVAPTEDEQYWPITKITVNYDKAVIY